MYDLSDRSIFGKLPDDVLCRIFSFSVAEGKATGVPTHPLPEVVVSHICRRWRRLALSIPTLWNFFRFDGKRDLHCRVPLDRLEAYLERSQDKPFDLRLYPADDHDERSREADLVYASASLCNKPAYRLRICRLQTDVEGMLDELPVSGGREPTPTLQALTVVQPQAWDEIPDYDLQPTWRRNIFNGEAPRLKYVHLDGSSIARFQPPLDTVVHLRLESSFQPTPSCRFNSKVLNYILTLPHIETLSVKGAFFHLDEDDPSTESVQSSSLRHFRCDEPEALMGQVPLGVEYFLTHVSAPALQSITLEEIRSLRYQKDWNQPDPASFPSLHALALQHVDLKAHRLRSIFSATPTVQHLIWSQSYHPSESESRDDDEDEVSEPYEGYEDCWPSIEALPDVLQGSGLLSQVKQVTLDGSLTGGSEKLLRPTLASVFPKLCTVKVREEYSEAVRGDGAELGRTKVTTIKPTTFPENGWIEDPRWIEVGDGAFSGWEYYNCLDLDEE
ncbi:hypothetical protein NMY22_g16123 [Coprinellus aureogranulatus]|nr:hypothetical protein NMY22_g16123 [Coprinellus aureogranulatus]